MMTTKIRFFCVHFTDLRNSHWSLPAVFVYLLVRVDIVYVCACVYVMAQPARSNFYRLNDVFMSLGILLLWPLLALTCDTNNSASPVM